MDETLYNTLVDQYKSNELSLHMLLDNGIDRRSTPENGIEYFDVDCYSRLLKDSVVSFDDFIKELTDSKHINIFYYMMLDRFINERIITLDELRDSALSKIDSIDDVFMVLECKSGVPHVLNSFFAEDLSVVDKLNDLVQNNDWGERLEKIRSIFDLAEFVQKYNFVEFDFDIPDSGRWIEKPKEFQDEKVLHLIEVVRNFVDLRNFNIAFEKRKALAEEAAEQTMREKTKTYVSALTQR